MTGDLVDWKDRHQYLTGSTLGEVSGCHSGLSVDQALGVGMLEFEYLFPTRKIAFHAAM